MPNRWPDEVKRVELLPSALMTERGKTHTIEEWLAQPPERRVELIDGAFVEKAAPDGPHSTTQVAIVGSLYPSFYGSSGGSGAGEGGWWLMTEPDVQLGANGYRPDVAGWRIERAPQGPPQGRPITLTPDWICEIVSDTNRPNDTVRKLRRHHEAGVPHYWLLDPSEGTLTVFKLEPRGYASILSATRDQRVRAEPFLSVELKVGVLLGADPSR
jgi:Uma2 family endonuclease